MLYCHRVVDEHIRFYTIQNSRSIRIGNSSTLRGKKKLSSKLKGEFTATFSSRELVGVEGEIAALGFGIHQC